MIILCFVCVIIKFSFKQSNKYFFDKIEPNIAMAIDTSNVVSNTIIILNMFYPFFTVDAISRNK